MFFLVRISHYDVKLIMHPKMIERNSRAIQIGTNMRKLSTIGSLVRIQLSQNLPCTLGSLKVLQGHTDWGEYGIVLQYIWSLVISI